VFSWPSNYDYCYTLAGVISREGIGLHSGEKTRVTISSYEKEGYYVSFKDKPNEIFKLTQDLIGSTMLCTAVKLGGRNLYTIEHLLSSMAGCGLSYIHIEVDGKEIPLLDGSAIQWVKDFEEVGIKKAPKPDNFFREINKSIILNKEGSVIAATPSEKTTIISTISFAYKAIGNQTFIIDLKEIKELDFIKVNKNNLEVGASTPLIKFEKEIKKHYPDFYLVLKRYGSVQIRNVGTIGGNIATASPIGDTLPILLSLNAEILIESFNQRKVIPINNFFLDYRKTKLKKNEFIHSIKIPLFKKNIFKAFKISKRFDDDISSVCGSFNFEIDNNKIKEVFIAFGGMAAVPKRAKACEKILKNKPLNVSTFNQAKNSLYKDLSPIGDMRASKEYRLEIAKNLLMKCFVEIDSNKLTRVN